MKDLRYPAGLTARLAKPVDAVSGFVRDRLTPPTLARLARWEPGNEPSAALRNSLIHNLNGILADGLVWDTTRFAGVALRVETAALLQCHPTGVEVIRVNRLLLEDAFPTELARINLEAEPLWWRLSMVASAGPLPNAEDQVSVTMHYERVRPLGIQCATLFGVDDPEAVFHDAYLSIIRRPAADAKAWAYLPYRIRCRANSAYRKAARDAIRLPTTSLALIPTDRLSSGHSGASDGRIVDRANELLETLPEAHRHLLRLQCLDGHSLAELARMAILGTTVPGVKSNLYQIRMRLRQSGHTE